MQTSVVESSIEHTSIGRIVVPPDVPPGFSLFYTTIDFDGRIDERIQSLAPQRLVQCHQVHGIAVRPATSDPRPATCDALWTNQPDTALAIKVADCLPVSLIDPKNGVIANIHSGWRGTAQGITAATLDAAPLDPASTTAWLGPSIRVCCFEVGEEVGTQFAEPWVDRGRGPKPHVDIIAFTADILRRRGIPRIVDTGLCTRCDGSIFHSYRRDKRGGRNLAIVAR